MYLDMEFKHLINRDFCEKSKNRYYYYLFKKIPFIDL